MHLGFYSAQLLLLCALNIWNKDNSMHRKFKVDNTSTEFTPSVRMCSAWRHPERSRRIVLCLDSDFTQYGKKCRLGEVQPIISTDNNKPYTRIKKLLITSVFAYSSEGNVLHKLYFGNNITNRTRLLYLQFITLPLNMCRNILCYF